MAKTEATSPEEIIEPLSDVEAGLCSAVERWREQQKEQLERAWQNVLNESNSRIGPVLKAHGVTTGMSWELRPDETSKTGWALVKKATEADKAGPRVDARREVRENKRKAEKALNAPRQVR